MPKFLEFHRIQGLCTIQDKPRVEGAQWGISAGGAADNRSKLWANTLLSQDQHAPVLELAMFRGTFIFAADSQIAVTGAPAMVFIDGQRQPMWTTLDISQGQKLEIVQGRQGQYSYLGFNGALDAKEQFGALSMSVREHLGVNHGRPFRSGDYLDGDPAARVLSRVVPFSFRPKFEQVFTVGLIPSFQFRQLAKKVKQQFFGQYFEVGQQSDKMGIRLLGNMAPTDLITQSEGMVCGAVQLPPDGQPIVMLCGHQTLGGYPKIGVVPQSDIGKLAQAVTGCKIAFRLTSRQKAQKLCLNAQKIDHMAVCRVI